MKLGILTFHNAHNYGAVLQCYALKEVLKAMGHCVHVIDYRQRAIDEFYYYKRSCTLHNILSSFKHLKPLRIIDLFKDDCELKRIIPVRKNIFELFQQNYLELLPCVNNEVPGDFDAYIIGSDMFWSDECMGKRFDPVYMGYFKHQDRAKVIGYAISGTPASFIKCSEQFHFDFLDNFTSVSVREKRLESIIEGSIKEQIPVCLDPT
jgi:hypothetical protein